ncbi:hypothetical protein PC116_g6317 [Phytophthora cactorum]|uniref:Uncharacterized protein n=1 Tax=Phytophthora cactorum TaxID=29920 RepID=A0A329SNA3_9STRA|nr:hypothetical protein PC111_g15653 [Phytophthora cactorum]KAG2909179.1 hypothetical protein PC115_g13345 [Phytophthora cactorum]KAG2922170.1 hypothetical protein PC114_g5361 [Phytophthora cactorum]KAG2993079.1 hypothetical protein PC118_g4197 [Phytophthora cactorum]KAG3029344.1 hypothetical protein PC120_g4359 [Phytophthora cactorum]
MVKYLEQVEEMNALIKRGELPKRDPKLEKFELDMN